MGESFTQLAAKNGGSITFSSSQSRITIFLGGMDIPDFGGVCLALVMLWYRGDDYSKDPCNGIKNKTTAMKLQSKLDGNWEGLETVESEGPGITGQKLWYRTPKLSGYMKGMMGPEGHFKNDPTHEREAMHVYAIYFKKGAGHAIGVWRFANTTFVVYDPNHGAAIIPEKYIASFMASFIENLYPDALGWGNCAFYREKR